MGCACLVFILHPVSGDCAYQDAAQSSFQAARAAIREHKKHHPLLSDETVVRVVLDGTGHVCWDYIGHNARQPNFRHRVGAARQVSTT
jgi:hypothetical protein